MSDDMQAYREVFMQESAEFLQGIIDGMLALERDPGDYEPVEVVFRGAHSLKGMAAAMGYEQTTELTHRMESLMSTVRDRRQVVDHDLVDLMLRAADAVKALIDDESEGKSDYDASSIMEEVSARAARAEEAAAAEGSTEPSAAEGAGDVLQVTVTLEEGCVLKSVRAYMVIKRLSHMGTVLETVPSAQDIEDERFGLSFDVVLHTTAAPADVQHAAEGVTEVASAEVTVRSSGSFLADSDADVEGGPSRRRSIPKLSETQTVRIAIGHLDNMVDLVGELVITRSRLEEIGRRQGDADLSEALEDLHRISGELQHEVMETRMVPVGNIFNRFPRMVRDLARDLGREVEFEMDGLDIELDRTVLDEIGDPLVHLLRNAVDHGIEPPDRRVEAGKEPMGKVRLAASRERDQVRVSVSDDGHGMDVERIWKAACERGLVMPEQRDAYSDAAVLQLTCTQGFSTQQEATKVSGRGVGMDVVRGKIEYLGGSLMIDSTPGEGTEFVLSLPLTLAIIQALMVGSKDRLFALPLGAVGEVLSPSEANVDSVEGGPVVRLRDGRVAPLYRLDWLVGLSDDATRLPEPSESVVLVEAPDRIRALTVERLSGRQEVVIKPLSGLFKGLRGLSGATVLGDGSVALILDPRMLFAMGEERS